VSSARCSQSVMIRRACPAVIGSPSSLADGTMPQLFLVGRMLFGVQAVVPGDARVGPVGRRRTGTPHREDELAQLLQTVFTVPTLIR